MSEHLWKLRIVSVLGLEDVPPRAVALGVSAVGVCGVSLLSVPLHLTLGDPQQIPLAVSGACGFMSVWIALRRLRAPQLAAVLYVLSSLLTLLGALVQDGGMGSPATPWLGMLPAIFYALGGVWAGVAGLAGTVGLVMLLSVVDARIQAAFPASATPGEYGVHLILVAVAMVSLVVARETAVEKARNEAKSHNEARAQAEASNEAKSAVLASMSHEIRTPLHGILGNVELMLGDTQNEALRSRLRTVQSSGELLLSIIEDVLDVARIESGFITLRPASVRPRDLVYNVLEMLYARAAQQSVAVQAGEVIPGDAEWVALDPQRTRQVLLNIVGNAIKFTPPGGSVQVSSVVRGGLWSVTVRDTGIGIPDEKLQAIFEPFVQVEGRTQRRHGGTGLGLSICRHLVKQMGGTISVQSTEGVGSTFTVAIPVEAVPAPAHEDGAETPADSAVSSASPSPSEVPASPLTVLVADDNPVNRQVLDAMLQRLGHRVVLAVDGQDAVAQCRQQPVDCVLMDIEMPVLDGLSATRVLRAQPITAGIPVFAVTASVLPEDRARAEAAGMTGFVPKPVRSRDLSALLDGLQALPRSLPRTAALPDSI